ncbi:MAG: ATP-binding protein [Bifidobacteriaceae bacterium]|jgi:predicted AAA+ superfamily ATPase|nr:ATP-binding protein [Bifidobacteriaceae bacterium]
MLSVEVERSRELAALARWRDADLIKVVTGVRRCGKSTLLRQFARRLAAEGVPPERVVSLNMEDFALAPLLNDVRAFHEHVAALLPGRGRSYLFIDEVGLVESFETAVNSLALNFDVDIYVTGSNAQMLSSDLATRLSGRYVEIHLLPFSFAEFIDGRRLAGLEDEDMSYPGLYGSFLRWGGFPFVQSVLPVAEAVRDYLDGLVNTILVKDVAQRRRVAQVGLLRDVATFVLHNVGNLTSLQRIANSLSARGRGPSPNTVDGYLDGLVDAFLVYPLRRWDARGLRHLSGPDKYYAVDTGLRNNLVGYLGGDTGHLLENIAYLELRRRSSEIRVGATPHGEIDFVTVRGSELAYYQVCESVRDPKTLARELAPLQAVGDHHPKTLLTLDPDPPISHAGIRQLYILDWLRSA